MTNTKNLLTMLEDGQLDSKLSDIYGEDTSVILAQRSRYINTVKKYEELFGEDSVEIFSAPGRTEICGNHTDHQNGMVLAASINLDAIAIVGEKTDSTVEFISEGYDPIRTDICNPEVIEKEMGTTTALIKGVVKGFLNRGYKTGGFKAYVTSDVLGGSGLSSSAALESIIGTILSGMYNDMKVSATEIAIIGQYAENVYFGKPCGLMDQMACSVGGFVHIDFANPQAPVVNKIDYDIQEKGYRLCIVDTKGSHANLTDDYAAIPLEMKQVAAVFGKELLGEISLDEFLNQLPNVYKKVGDRAVLRAFHFLTENIRVKKAADALKRDAFEEFLSVIKESGASSYKYLQNVYSNRFEQEQAVSVSLALSEHYLQGNGVCRVHGGGFAGTIQAFVKKEAVDGYKEFIESVLGDGTCHVLQIRKYGGIKVC